MRMSGVSVTYGIMAPWPCPTETGPGPQRPPRPGDTMTGRRISARIAAVAPSATLAVDAKAKALQAAGRERHRLRRRRARLPHARAHRGGRRGGLPRPAEPQVHADRRAPRAAGGGGRQDPPRLGARGGRLPGAGHQRRQAGRRQLLRRPVRPGRRGAGARPLLDHLPRGHRPGRRGPGGRRHRRGQRLPGHRRPARGGPDRPHQGAAVRVALQPDRGGLPAPGDRGHRAMGRRARPVGPHRRDLRAPRLRGGRAPLDAGRWCPSWPTAASWSTAWPRPTP